MLYSMVDWFVMYQLSFTSRYS